MFIYNFVIYIYCLSRFERENEDKLENYLKAEFSSHLASTWFNFRLKIIGLIVLFFISSIAVFIHRWNLTNAGLFLLTIGVHTCPEMSLNRN